MNETDFDELRGRIEDEGFLTGAGCFTDDLAAQEAGAAHAVLLRSPYAHGEILSIDTGVAKASPGVLGVFTGQDIADDGLGPIPCMAPVTGKGGCQTIVPHHPVLALARVVYLGEPLALVVAESLAEAEDAAELIDFEVRELPAVTETARALDPAAPQIWPAAPGTRSLDWEIGDAAAVEAAFAAAAHVTEISVINNRVAVNQMEPRAALGHYDRESGRLTLTTPSQGVHAMRAQLAEHIFKLPEDEIRVITPDVGGAFGARVYCLNAQVLVLWAARRLGRPLRWTAERGECFFTDGQARDHISTAALALDAGGRFLALKVEIRANMGAYVIHYGPAIPTEFCCAVLAGAYRIPAIHAGVICLFTNTVPIDTYRGTGRAEAINLLERLVVLADGTALEVTDLPEGILRPKAELSPVEVDDDDLSVKHHGAVLEKVLIQRAMDRTAGNKTQAAELLELSPRALRYKIKDYGLE
jgi:carbon-monoxide dehydrogenase large subunit